MHAMSEPALPFRSDTMLGVCEALGSDFGFHPNWLRLALGSLVLWSPWIALGIYLGLGVIVGASRLIAPPQRATPQIATGQAAPDNSDSEQLPLAA